MILKTSELTGPALDWAVAKAEGYDEWEWDTCVSNIRRTSRTEHWLKGYFEPPTDWSQGGPIIEPSTDWSHGGPIIERERISLVPLPHDWEATIDLDEGDAMVQHCAGPTPLIAAMRCFVASRLGDAVDVPEELL